MEITDNATKLMSNRGQSPFGHLQMSIIQKLKMCNLLGDLMRLHKIFHFQEIT